MRIESKTLRHKLGFFGYMQAIPSGLSKDIEILLLRLNSLGEMIQRQTFCAWCMTGFAMKEMVDGL